MTSVTQMKCACASCLCIVNLSDAVMHDNQPFCSDACAQGHPDGSGCGHSGCDCGN